MLTAVEIFTPNGENLVLSLGDASYGFTIQDIDGLDPVNAQIVSSKFARLEGEQYQSSYREKRNIVFSLGMEAPNEYSLTVGGLRSLLYRFFMPKVPVRMRFYQDEVAFVDISGRVESFEAPLFTAEPEATLSVLCFDPDFLGLDDVPLYTNTVTDGTEEQIAYKGTIETGVNLKIFFTQNVTEFMVYNRTSSGDVQQMEINASQVPGGHFINGDTLEISTVPGNKYALLTRAGVESSVLYVVSPASNWISVQRGTNWFRVVVDSSLDHPETYLLNLVTRYGGL